MLLNRKPLLPVVPLEVDTAVVHKPHPHDSARMHVRGAAPYVDDIREPTGTLHVGIGMSNKAAGTLRSLDLDAVRAAPGVVAVLTAADIPGKNDIAPAFADEPLFADKEILFHGQALFAVVARTRDQARRAARLAQIDIAEAKPAITVDDAMQTGARVLPDYEFGRGDIEGALAASPHRLEGMFRIGGQEHFYLEGQASLAIPGEGPEMLVHASTQDPTEVQHIVARILAVPDAFVSVETRRMGGGFGGKESQACAWAAIAALGAQVTGAPCKVRLDRDDDFVLTGKRHDFRADWRVGYDDSGRITRLRSHAERAVRLLGRPFARRRRPCDVPCLEHLLAGDSAHRLAPPQDQHRLQHRLSRLRRSTRHDRDRACDRRHRAGARPRPARRPQGQLLPAGRRPDAL